MPRMKKKKKKRSPRDPARPAPDPHALHYKVVELSTVDEASLERALNEWVPRGWAFDGVQFAMRESSKRPAMGFLFFTRDGPPEVEVEPEPVPAVNPVTTTVHDAWERLRAFARDDEGGA